MDILHAVGDSTRGKCQGLQHRHGVVLWYMRRHAPMPNPKHFPASTAGTARATGSRDTACSQVAARSGQAPQVSRKICVGSAAIDAECGRNGMMQTSGARSRSVAGGAAAQEHIGNKSQGAPQQAFLHQALLAIGMEVDEARGGRPRRPRSGLGERPPLSGVGCRMRDRALARAATAAAREEVADGGQWLDAPLPTGPPRPASAEHRGHMRLNYARHTDSQFEDLRAQVEEQEATVASLRDQASALESRLEATRQATARRRSRLRGPRSEIHGQMQRSDSNASLASRPAASMGGIGITNAGAKVVPVVDQSSLRIAELENLDEEELMETINVRMITQKTGVARMQAEVAKATENYHLQTTRRKVVEASLFAAHTEVARLRGQALKTEARVHRLAAELRRVYATLPEVIQKHVADLAASKAASTETEVQELLGMHQEESFKYQEPAFLVEEKKRQNLLVQEAIINSEFAGQVVEHGNSMSADLLPSARSIESLVNGLEAAWSASISTQDEGKPRNETQLLELACGEAVHLTSKAKFHVLRLKQLLTSMGVLESRPPTRSNSGLSEENVEQGNSEIDSKSMSSQSVVPTPPPRATPTPPPPTRTGTPASPTPDGAAILAGRASPVAGGRDMPTSTPTPDPPALGLPIERRARDPRVIRCKSR